MAGYTDLRDEELVRHLRMGDEAAFTAIYNRHWEKLLATAFYFTHDKQSAEDIVHEVMMSLWIRKTEVNIDSLSPYLGTAVKFAVFKSIAREKRRRDLMTSYKPAETEADIENKLEAKFLEELLLGRTEQLPDKARLIFDYSRKHELTVAQIAEKMDLSPKAVEYHITRALRFLRQSLQKIKCLFI